MSGFENPNYTQAPNAFFDTLLPEIDSMSELKVTLVVIRQTFGYHKAEDELSISRLVELTGLSRPSVVDGVRRGLKRGTIARRTLDPEAKQDRYVYRARVVKNLNQSGDEASKDTEPVASKESLPTKERVKESNDSSNDESANGEPAELATPMPMGQFGMKELKERLAAARKRSAQVHSPTDRELKDFGFQFKQADKDGHSLDDMLLALDYMVAKASGEIETEPKAWCGYRTALDRVLDGWRPARALRVVRNPEHERMREENQAMLAELIGDVS